MGLVRKIIAYCDAVEVNADLSTKDCFESVALDPTTAQPFQRLTELGWTVHSATSGEIPLSCPKHAGARMIDKPEEP